MVDAGRLVGSTATGAAAGSVAGPWGTAIGAGVGFLGGLFGGDGNPAPAPPPSQYGGNPLTDQLAAQQYAAGLSQQQGQNSREAALYNQGNINYDIANQAQMRQGPQIQSSLADKRNQLAALGGTNAAIGNMNQTGQQLTALGTRPMGDSYAAAQMQQGLAGSMAQQLSMARSGRSLGSGQSAMQQAMFNNAALNQQTNQAAASARIQEQNAYNQFQAGALGAAGQQYGAAGALSGQAGNQATTIRTGNEGVQAQNANLNLQQQGINNQTTGLYNQLGSQQQQLGMQANQLGQNAYQFGAQQASGMMGAQLNADTGRLSATTATNLANQQNDNLHDAANANALATGVATAVSAAGDGGGGSSGTVNPNNPSGSTSPYASITKASNTAGPSASSDERLKKDIVPLSPGGATKPGATASERQKTVDKYAEFSPADAAAYYAADKAAATGKDTYTANGKTNVLRPYGINSSMDPDTNLKPVYGENQQQPPSYAEVVGALNSAYAPSQSAPADVLWHKPGAGAPASGSQASLLSYLGAPRPAQAMQSVTNAAIPDARLGQYATSAGPRGTSTNPRSAATAAPAAPAPSSNWGDVFNAPTLDPRIAAYLAGANPYPVVAPREPTYSPVKVEPIVRGKNNGVISSNPSDNYSTGPGIISADPSDNISVTNGLPVNYSSSYDSDSGGDFSALSDVHSKTRIKQLESQLAALQGPPSASFAPESPDTAALDNSEYASQVRPGWRNRDQLSGPSSYPHRWDADPFAVDLRPAQGYSYDYKDPSAPGAAPGRQVGPMAQDIERTAAAATVHDTPNGKQVDTGRLSMVNTAAISELQRKLERLEALGGGQQAPAPYSASLYPSPR
jgi:hypothetical protein